MAALKKTPLYICAAAALLYAALVLAAYLPHDSASAARLAGPDGRFVNLQGRTVHYVQQGSGPPVILVHGFGGSTFTWRRLIPLLGQHYTVYALDLPGFGLSDKSKEISYDYVSQGEVILDFMDALNVPDACLVGHSMGGVVAAHAAVLQPGRFSGLGILAGAFYSGGRPRFMKHLYFPLGRLLARLFYTRTAQKKMLGITYHNTSVLTDEVVAAYRVPAKTPNAFDSFAAMITGDDLDVPAGFARRITVPTLIVWGKNDKAVLPQNGRQLQSDITGAQLVYLEQCGHMIQEERPEELADLLLDFCRKRN